MIDNPFGGGIKKAPGLLKIISLTFDLKTHPVRTTGGNALAAHWMRF